MNGHPYLLLAVFLVAATAAAVVPLAVAWLWARWFAPPRPGRQKNATYECGLESNGAANIRFHARYYLLGIVFLVFDVELIFLLPFAAAFPKLSLGAFIAMLIFVALLVEGLAWAWVKGVLDWGTGRPSDGKLKG